MHPYQWQSEYELAYLIAQTFIGIYLEESKVASLVVDTNRTYLSYILLKNQYDEQRLLKSDLNKSMINHHNTVQFWIDELANLALDKVYLLFLMGDEKWRPWILY